MEVKRVGHIAFHCRDIEKSKTFYEKAFGCTEKFSINYGQLLENSLRRNPDLDVSKVPMLKMFREKAEQAWLYYMEFPDGFFFELFQSATQELAPEMGKLTGLQHIAIVVDDIYAAYAELVEKGINVKSEPALGPDNTWQFWITDPDNNQFEFMQYTNYSYQLAGNSGIK